MPQFDHRADNLLTDLETGKLPYAIDVTIRACHQQSLPTVARVVSAAVAEKHREFATKDDNGRKKAEVFVVPFVMTSMGNIDQGATKFLNSLKKRDPFKVKKLMDLISVQHAKWIAVRLRKCLGFHSKTMEASAGKMYLQPPKGPKHDRSRQGKKGEFARLTSVLSQPGSQSQQSAESTRRTVPARDLSRGNTLRVSGRPKQTFGKPVLSGALRSFAPALYTERTAAAQNQRSQHNKPLRKS